MAVSPKSDSFSKINLPTLPMNMKNVFFVFNLSALRGDQAVLDLASPFVSKKCMHQSHVSASACWQIVFFQHIGLPMTGDANTTYTPET